MAIDSLRVTQFRNIQSASFDFSPGLNVIVGPNGSGKTSLLESIYYLCVGKSFRTSRVQTLFNHSDESRTFTLFARIRKQDEHSLNVGVQRQGNNRASIRVNGQDISALSQLAYLNPVYVIEPHSILSLASGPNIRRKIFDWGLFHVEQSFGSLWQQYMRCLKQRNMMLRKGVADYSQYAPWDYQLDDVALKIDRLRSTYIENIKPVVEYETQFFGLRSNIEITYKCGWEREKRLIDCLKDSFNKDLKNRTTNHGPHRADFEVADDRGVIANTFSRGQLKTLFFSLAFAQIKVVKDRSFKSTVLLLDDLGAELDLQHRTKTFERVKQHDSQVICTLLDEPDWAGHDQMKMFHVEHGTFITQ